jgi:hypothetical protein
MKEQVMSRLMPRKRTIFGGVLAVGIAAGIYFGDKLPHLGSGFGLGSGGDGLLGKPDVSKVAGNSPDSSTTPGRAESDSSSDQFPDEDRSPRIRKPIAPNQIPPDDVLTVLVEEHHYAVWKKTRRGNGYFPTTLAAIVEMALQVPANSEGLRVRVVYTKAARYPAWHMLQKELVAAGVPTESILLTEEMVD